MSVLPHEFFSVAVTEIILKFLKHDEIHRGLAQIWKVQILAGKIQKIPDLAGKIWKIPNLAGKIWKIPHLASKIWKIPDLATHTS